MAEAGEGGRGEAAGEAAARGVVKWFNAAKGFGFVVLDAPRADAFLHAAVVRRSGLGEVRQGDRIECLVRARPRGLQVGRVLAVHTPAGGARLVARVKFFDGARGYGFVRDGDGVEVFVGAKLLKSLGLPPRLREDQKVSVSAVRGERGLVAETLSFLAD